MDRDVRDMTQFILTFLVNKLFDVDDYDTIDRIMSTAFGFLPDEACKNWLKLSQYLSVIINSNFIVPL